MELQTQATGIAASTVELPEQPSMEEYEKVTERKILELKAEGFSHAAFGDIFLEDLKTYREVQYQKLSMKTLFPLWKSDTTALLDDFIKLGFKAVVIAAKAEFFNQSFVGRIIDQSFVKELPKDVDPCGENGEFHTFCYDGPIFQNPIEFELGEKTFREYDTPKEDGIHIDAEKMGFWFCDLLAKTKPT